MEHEVSKATSISFKTIDESDTKHVSFNTIEETNNKSISFKTFDDWVKARTAKCDTALKDALSFISEKKSALDREKDTPQAGPAQLEGPNPSNIDPSSQWIDSPIDPQQLRKTPMDRGEIPMECRIGESTMEPMRTQQPRETPMDRGEITMECRRREFMMDPMRMSPMESRQRQKSCEYSHTTSPYNTDGTAKIKATSNVATQTDSFQDHLGETSE